MPGRALQLTYLLAPDTADKVGPGQMATRSLSDRLYPLFLLTLDMIMISEDAASTTGHVTNVRMVTPDPE